MTKWFNRENNSAQESKGVKEGQKGVKGSQIRSRSQRESKEVKGSQRESGRSQKGVRYTRRENKRSTSTLVLKIGVR